LKGVDGSPGGTIDWTTPHAARFKEAMDDDFGTPEAVAVLHELANEAFQGRPGAAGELRRLGAVLGLLQRDPQAFLQAGAGKESDAWVGERISARQAARQRKDFKEADDIRKDLLDKGIVLEDSGSSTTWRRK
jgi:cysteinyl-tRNA synthetase